MRHESPTVLQYGTQAPRVNGGALTTVGLLIFVTHVACQFVLYRGRVVDQLNFGDSVVFFMPLTLALVGYALVWSRVAQSKPWDGARKVAFVIALTLVTGFFSLLGSMLLPMNMLYGT